MFNFLFKNKTGELVGMMMVNDDNDIMMITTEGVIIRIHAEDINIIGRNTSGVRLMRTTETNLIVSCAKTDKEEDAAVDVADVLAEGEEAVDEVEIDSEVFVDDTAEPAANDNDGPDYEAGKDILNKLDIE